MAFCISDATRFIASPKPTPNALAHTALPVGDLHGGGPEGQDHAGLGNRPPEKVNSRTETAKRGHFLSLVCRLKTLNDACFG